MSMNELETEEEIETTTEEEIKEPPRYKVLLLNDDYTTMDFVIEILITVFRKSFAEATKIMLNVHKNGVGICGVYPYEVAETKVAIVHATAQDRGFPLRCTIEKE
ncbi:MAG: ATP-dependent Clp protease adapter ClpS [Desulfobacterales bacterium]|nr:ATP-dependent Clp protease adapter ClpS [Desulfobacterales bacterium]MBF0395152.1 ATP-dependent Clp protease adapter ClpS [Desulfobacterales bacterium]